MGSVKRRNYAYVGATAGTRLSNRVQHSGCLATQTPPLGPGPKLGILERWKAGIVG